MFLEINENNEVITKSNENENGLFIESVEDVEFGSIYDVLTNTFSKPTKTLDMLKFERIYMIDQQTGIDIELLVGDNNKQKDLLAEASILLEKKFDGIITPDETIRKEELSALWAQVSLLKSTGNQLELDIASTTTIEELNLIL